MCTDTSPFSQEEEILIEIFKAVEDRLKLHHRFHPKMTHPVCA
jgi:hypothetical protein